ncbi:MAG: hypothetical protein HZC37_06565 [Burkholderiales bacterium]|nr:hypothetical protein [Burkholderiales bacterium]
MSTTISIIATAPRPFARPWARLRVASRRLAALLGEALARRRLRQQRQREHEVACLLASSLDARTLRDLGLDGLAEARREARHVGVGPQAYRHWA